MELEELEKRVRILEDIEEIKKLQNLYVNALTQADFKTAVECFSKNGVIDLHYGYAKGKEEVAKIFREKIGRTHVGLEGNFMVQPIITVDGDTAKGNYLLYIQYARPRSLPPEYKEMLGDEMPDWMQGYYNMEYVREDGKWKISLLYWRRRLMSPRELSTR
jgi:hypothetical protein